MSADDAKKLAARAPVPPVGQRLDFDSWCRLLTVELRRYLPTVAATTNGRGRVTWRYGGLEVTAHNDRGCYRIQLDPRFGGLQDNTRRDAFTAVNCAMTLAIHFDASLPLADRQ